MVKNLEASSNPENSQTNWSIRQRYSSEIERYVHRTKIELFYIAQLIYRKIVIETYAAAFKTRGWDKPCIAFFYKSCNHKYTHLRCDAGCSIRLLLKLIGTSHRALTNQSVRHWIKHSYLFQIVKCNKSLAKLFIYFFWCIRHWNNVF